MTQCGYSFLISRMSEPKPKPVRLGVLLSGGGRTLLNILSQIDDGKLNAEVAVVIASRECKGADHARAAGLDVHVVPYKQIPDKGTYSRRITELLDAAGVDLVCLAGFLSFWELPPQYQGRVMNIHPALLPSFGGKGCFGRRVHTAVLAAGCKVSGCTVHFVDNHYDEGPIIIQRCVPIDQDDTPETLFERVFEQECVAYPDAIRLFAENRLRIDGKVVHVQKD